MQLSPHNRPVRFLLRSGATGGIRMQFRTLNLAIVPAVAIGMAACSSSSNQPMDNGVIASASHENGEFSNIGTAAFQYSAEGEELEISWNKGPLKNTTRTFELINDTNPPVLEYDLESMTEDGYLFAVVTADAAFSMGAVIPDGSGSTTYGAAHFGTKPTNVPTSGTANYVGATAGAFFEGTSVDAYTGTTNVAVNFGTGGVSGTMTNLAGDGITLGDIGFTGTLDTGKSTYSANSLTWGGQSASGTLLGGLYGPGATSTAGAYNISAEDTYRAIGGYVAVVP